MHGPAALASVSVGTQALGLLVEGIRWQLTVKNNAFKGNGEVLTDRLEDPRCFSIISP